MLAQLIANEGSAETLSRVVEIADVFDFKTFEFLADKCGVDDPPTLLARFCDTGILMRVNEGYSVSNYGERLDILFSGIDGRETIDEVVRRLYLLDPRSRPYELLTGRLTERFISTLAARPDFIRLLICSPWIRLQGSLKQQFIGAFYSAEAMYPGSVQLEVITRPVSGRGAWADQLRETLVLMRKLGATVYTNRNLHAKLFMRQPGPNGGLQSATLGSENLTGAGNVELGIRIDNDSQILHKLRLWFHDVSCDSKLSGGVP